MESAGHLRDMLAVAQDLGEPFVTGVAPFDRLSPVDQLGSLLIVARALLDDGFPAPQLTPAREATIYAVYRSWLTPLELELERDFADPWIVSPRQLTVNALRSVSDSQSQVTDWAPPVDCRELPIWEQAVEELVDRVLWDRDFLSPTLLQLGIDPLISVWLTPGTSNHLGTLGPTSFERLDQAWLDWSRQHLAAA